MKASQIIKPGKIETIQAECPEPRENELRLKVFASGICGTDVHIYRGEYLGDYPIIPGHEFAGVVEAAGSQVTRFKPGDRVAIEPNIACDNCYNCLNNRQNFCCNWQGVGVTRPGGMEQFATVPEKAAFNIGDLSFEQAAFMEPLSCVLHGIERLGMELGDKVAILGAGPIGSLLLQVARLQGASQITVVDKNPFRADSTKELGADITLNSLDSLQSDFYDDVIDATGSLPVMARSIDFARPGGRVLLFGVPPSGKDLNLEAFKIFRKGLTVLSSYTSVRNSFQAADLLSSGGVRVEPLVSHRLPLDEFERGIHLIESGQDHVRKVLILPNA